MGQDLPPYDEEEEQARLAYEARQPHRGGYAGGYPPQASDERPTRVMAERNAADFNRQRESSPQDQKGGWEAEPKSVNKRGLSQQPPAYGPARSAKEDYNSIRQKYGLHAGGFNIISHQVGC